MSAGNLADRIRMNRKSRSPVQDTVDKLFDEITGALAAGGSFRAIHSQLTREGHNVGKRHNSLFAAYKVVKLRRGDPLRASLETAKAPGRHVEAKTVVEESASTPSRQMPTAVVDSRRKIDEW